MLSQDTVEKLAKEKIDDCMSGPWVCATKHEACENSKLLRSFEWISQLRYYWEMDDRNSETRWHLESGR